MSELLQLQNQLSALTEQLAELNKTTKEQYRKSKLGNKYNPFSSEYASTVSSSDLDITAEDVVRLKQFKKRLNPFTNNRLDSDSINASRMMYLSPQERIRFDTRESERYARMGRGVAEVVAGAVGAKIGGGLGAAAGGAAALALGGLTGGALSLLLAGTGSFVGGGIGASMGAKAFNGLSGQNERASAGAIHKYMMENSFRFLNPTQSRGQNNPIGAGFGYKDSRELSRNITMMTDDTNLSAKTLMELTRSFSEGNLMKGVNNTKEFSKRFKGLAETAKKMAYLLNDSVEDAGKFMSELQIKGYDMSRIGTGIAKMKNLSQYLGKETSEVVQTAIEKAGANVAGTNNSFTTAVENQTYSSQLMSSIQDAFLKGNDPSYKTGYNVVQNLGGPEEAASVLDQITRSMLGGEKSSMTDQVVLAGAVYNAETKSFSYDAKKANDFMKMGLSAQEGFDYAQSALEQEYYSKMKEKYPDQKIDPMAGLSEFYSNKQSIIGDIESPDRLQMIRMAMDQFRKEPRMANMSDQFLLTKGMGLDETSANLIGVALRKSTDTFAAQYEDAGKTANYMAERRKDDTGLTGAIKKAGSKVMNDIATAGMVATNPITDFVDKVAKSGSDFLFGKKDFNAEAEFGVSSDVFSKYLSGPAGTVDIEKMGDNFYTEFVKGLEQAQKNGKSTISNILLTEMRNLRDGAARGDGGDGTLQGVTTARSIASGKDYLVSRWDSKDGLSGYNNTNYDKIKETAKKYEISDQTLGFIGQSHNLKPEDLETAAAKLQKYTKDYGGNETLAIAAYDAGQTAVDQKLASLGIDEQKIKEMRSNGNFSVLNGNTAVSQFSKDFMNLKAQEAKITESAYAGKSKTIQSKSTVSKSPAEIAAAPPQEIGTILAAVSNAISNKSSEGLKADGVIDARLKALGIEVKPGMSLAEKEALLAGGAKSFSPGIADLEAYVMSDKQALRKRELGDKSDGKAKEFEALPVEERMKVINAYLSKTAADGATGTAYEKEMFKRVQSNYDEFQAGTNPKFNKETVGAISSTSPRLKLFTQYTKVDGESVDSGIKMINLDELSKIAEQADKDSVKTVTKAQKDAEKFLAKLKLDPKKATNPALAKQELTSALYSGDAARMEEVATKYGLSKKEKEQMIRTGTLKVGDSDTFALSANASAIKDDNKNVAAAMINKTKFEYAAAQSLLSDLEFSDDEIDALSIPAAKLGKTTIDAIQANKGNLMKKAADKFATMSDAELNKVLAGGRFSTEEIGLLTKDNGDGKAGLTYKDGAYSFAPGVNKAALSEQMAEYARETWDAGNPEGKPIKESQDDKGEGASKNLGKATDGMVSTMETTTDVMIEATKVLLAKQEALAKIVGVRIPTPQKSSPTTGMPSTNTEAIGG